MPIRNRRLPCRLLPLLFLATALPARALDTAAIAAFFDAYMPERMAGSHVAGASVCVVQDGRTVFAKGYGYADVDRGISVAPEATLFRIGSMSKLFAWTAVMQLVERAGRAAAPRRMAALARPGAPASPRRAQRLRELWRGPGRLHRRAGLRPALRRVR